MAYLDDIRIACVYHKLDIMAIQGPQPTADFKRANYLIEKKLRREIAEHTAPKFVLYYESGSGRDYSDAANAIAQSAGTFSEVTLLFQWCLSGAGWDESSLTNDRWRGYRRWRATNG
jgi:hypothetical protein